MSALIKPENKPLQRLLGGFIRLHILHHAAEDCGVVGNWMIEELRHHGYRLSPGTLYPILHAMEDDGWLKSTTDPVGGTRRIYRITREGRNALRVARERLSELLHEVHSAVRLETVSKTSRPKTQTNKSKKS